MGMPFSVWDLQAEAAAIAGREPGKRWHKKFFEQFLELRPLKAIKLDPKHAKNFNETVIQDYFDQMEHLHARFPGRIPVIVICEVYVIAISLGCQYNAPDI